MRAAAAELEFEEAARLRDEIRRLEATELGLEKAGMAPRAAAEAAGWSPQAKAKSRKKKRAKRRRVGV